MKIKHVHSFSEFLNDYKMEFPEGMSRMKYHSDVVFRGQSDCRFELKTTLERYSGKNFSFRDYLVRLDLSHDELSAYTGRRWYSRQPSPNIRNPHEIASRWELLEFMIYMRHYGFPSPLLDWTLSPYIAAFFAYMNRRAGDDVAIYAYMEMMGSPKSGWSGESHISVFGSNSVTADRRHHTQQARYTICTRKEDEEHFFASHEDAFGRDDPKQDRLVKYILPGEEMDETLDRLNLMNINSYTLFNNEEGLAQHLAFKNLKRLELPK